MELPVRPNSNEPLCKFKSSPDRVGLQGKSRVVSLPQENSHLVANRVAWEIPTLCLWLSFYRSPCLPKNCHRPLSPYARFLVSQGVDVEQAPAFFEQAIHLLTSSGLQIVPSEFADILLPKGCSLNNAQRCDVGSFSRADRQICHFNALGLGRVPALSHTCGSCLRFRSLSHRKHDRVTLKLHRLARSNMEYWKCRGDLLEFRKRCIFVHGHVRSRTGCALQVSPQDG